MQPGTSLRKSESRRHRRHEASGLLQILWEDAAGQPKMSHGRIVNVSVEGVQVRLDEKIPVRTYVYCTDAKLGIRGRASVRYCNFSRGRYQIGLEFSGGSGWNEPSEAPE
jgi:hypothetical protein